MGTRRTATPERDPSAVAWVTVQTRTGPQHRYRDTSTGRYISARQVRGDIDRMVDAAGKGAARQMTTALKDGRISLAEWQSGMARAVKNVNYAAVAAASGGVNNMTAVERGRAGAIIREQYKHLRNFAKDIETGKQPLDGRALRRADMYMDAARGSYHDQKRAAEAAAHPGQAMMIRSIRHPGDSCRQCVELHGKWFPLGSADYVPVGRRLCRTSCRCSEETAVVDEGGNVVPLGVDGY